MSCFVVGLDWVSEIYDLQFYKSWSIISPVDFFLSRPFKQSSSDFVVGAVCTQILCNDLYFISFHWMSLITIQTRLASA